MNVHPSDAFNFRCVSGRLLYAAVVAITVQNSVTIAAAQTSVGPHFDINYPCASHLSLQQKQYLADYANAVKIDPCMLDESEFDALLSGTDARENGDQADAPGAATDRANPLQNYAGQRGQMVMSLQCTMSGAAMLGYPGPIGNHSPTYFTVNLNSDGSLVVNGKRIAASYVHEEGEKLTLSMIQFGDFFRALAGYEQGSGKAMFLDDEESAALDALMNAAPGIVMGNRNRIVVFDVANRNVVFGDISNGQIQSPRQADCLAVDAGPGRVPSLPYAQANRPSAEAFMAERSWRLGSDDLQALCTATKGDRAYERELAGIASDRRVEVTIEVLRYANPGTIEATLINDDKLVQEVFLTAYLNNPSQQYRASPGERIQLSGFVYRNFGWSDDSAYCAVRVGQGTLDR